MMKQKIVLGIALSLGIGSALATVSLEAYAKTHQPTPRCGQLIQELSMHYASAKNTAERQTLHEEVRSVCDNDGSTPEQKQKNLNYFNMFANLPY